MWQEAVRTLLNRSYHFQVRNVASPLARPLSKPRFRSQRLGLKCHYPIQERGIVIIIVQPSSNRAHTCSRHYLGQSLTFQHHSEKHESIPFRRCGLYLVMRKGDQKMVEYDA
jgi:hypothetical protein